MNWLQGVLVIVGLVVLRVGLPMAIMVLIVRLLHLLEAKWQAEAR